jgi:hypothetical protein
MESLAKIGVRVLTEPGLLLQAIYAGFGFPQSGILARVIQNSVFVALADFLQHSPANLFDG